MASRHRPTTSPPPSADHSLAPPLGLYLITTS
uniref:Predicted protein n=1 Tax=Hordeum vulgare subsp. vulgare TaxID=112509 RepID=F2E554_HORVV|nr:predicted protein [Hordeum vulgare subsp. vulgare]